MGARSRAEAGEYVSHLKGDRRSWTNVVSESEVRSTSTGSGSFS